MLLLRETVLDWSVHLVFLFTFRPRCSSPGMLIPFLSISPKIPGACDRNLLSYI